MSDVLLRVNGSIIYMPYHTVVVSSISPTFSAGRVVIKQDKFLFAGDCNLSVSYIEDYWYAT